MLLDVFSSFFLSFSSFPNFISDSVFPFFLNIFFSLLFCCSAVVYVSRNWLFSDCSWQPCAMVCPSHHISSCFFFFFALIFLFLNFSILPSSSQVYYYYLLFFRLVFLSLVSILQIKPFSFFLFKQTQVFFLFFVIFNNMF